MEHLLTKALFSAFFLIFFPISAQAISQTRCEEILLKHTNSKIGDNVRPIRYSLLFVLYPELKRFKNTLRQFNEWGIQRAIKFRDERTWEIKAHYEHGPVHINLKKVGYTDEPFHVSVSISVVATLDPRVNELHFLIASTMSEAKHVLGIKENEILQVKSPSVNQYGVKPWYADSIIARNTNQSWDRFYEVENRLLLTFVGLLIDKLEAGQFSGDLHWIPPNPQMGMVQVGNSFAYFRNVATDRQRPRVEIVLGNYFMFQFEEAAKRVGLKPFFSGSYQEFCSQMVRDMISADAQLLPETNSGTNYYVDIPSGGQEHPVAWVAKRFAETLSRFMARTY
jgi:hypothetical protein